ncbi:hypothetical protein ROJ8625_00136 [Roseivivax jejudonensis]|uniref:Uncharacterized protein n=1 Tax=Roseivivax jejudonensis TaxID=1529041 RepID=A0A1X6Y3T7_9RHOB|nr:hypothetical protein [Roseivivax jejudonensis]SLN09976.1 hypothetical protein ROJ8625_00136 [Roseivivax jejudonensis]
MERVFVTTTAVPIDGAQRVNAERTEAEPSYSLAEDWERETVTNDAGSLAEDWEGEPERTWSPDDVRVPWANGASDYTLAEDWEKE